MALLPAEADADLLRRLVAAGDRVGAAQLLVEQGEQLLDGGAGEAVLSAAAELKLGDDPALLAVLGYARQLSGDWLGALAAYRAAAGDGPLQPRLAQRYGQLCYVGGKVDEAIEVYERAVCTTPPTAAEIELRCYAAIWLRAAGDDKAAHRTATEAATAAERYGHLAATARGHWALALLAAHDGDRAEHDLHHQRGLRLAEQLDDGMLQLGLTINRASYLAEEGPPAEALAEAETARRLSLQFGLTAYEPLCRSIVARALARLGRFDAALSTVDESIARWRDIGPSFDVPFAQIVRADVHCRRGEPGLAQAALAESLAAAGDAGSAEAGAPAADERRDESGARRELVLERGERLAAAGGGDVDRVERRLLRQPERAVADDERDVADPRSGERVTGPAREVGVALDRPDVGGERGEDRGVVARAGAHVEHAVLGAQLEQLGHARDDERLGDRLAAADGERGVVVRVRAQVLGHERLARDARDRAQDPLVADVLTQLGDESGSLAHRITP